MFQAGSGQPDPGGTGYRGRPQAEPGEKITSDTVVYVDGKAVKKVEEKVLLLFYKPRGVVCSTKKQRQETTVTEYLNYPLRVYPIGRLDKTPRASASDQPGGSGK